MSWRWSRATIAILLLSSFSSAFGDELVGRVVGVSDGDTLTLLVDGRKQHKIRLAGIDAPEKRQPYGQRSKEQLSGLAYNQVVRVVWNKRDRYGRIVGKVFSKDNDLNIAMVASGLAWHFKYYESDQTTTDRRAYALAEASARSGRLGLWTQPNPIPPWIFRRAVR